MANKENNWHLAVSKEEINEKLEALAKQHSILKGRLIPAASNKMKLGNALSAYAHLEQDEEAVILYDDTVFGGAREGFVVTNKNVFTHNFLSDPEKVSIDSITKLCLVDGALVFNMSKATLTGLSSATRKDVTSFLQSIIFNRTKGNEKNTKSGASTEEPPAQTKQKPVATTKSTPQKNAAAKETGENKTPAKADGAKYLTIQKGVVTKCDEKATEVIIPDSVTKIGKAAFGMCTALESVELPDSVTEIGDGAFNMCTSLKYIEIPDSVTKIRIAAFGMCTALESVELPDSVTEIGESAFIGCESLKYIEIPDSVAKIGKAAFGMCTSLESVKISDGVTKIGEWAFSECTSLKSIKLPVSVTEIGEKAFAKCASLESIEIPDSVTKIGKGSFGMCTSLESVKISDGVTEIGENAFQECTSLKSIEIPNSVTEIGKAAFAKCASLESIEIPDSVTKIGKATFFECTSLKKITYSGTIDEWYKIEEGDGWYYNAPATIVHCVDGDVPLDEDDEDSDEINGKEEFDSSKYFQSELFEGFLYDDFGIGAIGNIRDIERKLQEQLQQQGGVLLDDIEYQIDFVEGELYTERVVNCSSIKICGFPVSEQGGIGLLTDYENDLYLGNLVAFTYSDEAECNRICDMVNSVLDKYGYKEDEDKKSRKYTRASGVQLYALPHMGFWGNSLYYEDERDTRYIGIMCSDDTVMVCSLFGYSARRAWISSAEKVWRESICLNTEDYHPEIYGVSDTFNKLLNKWEDILSRDDAKGKVTVTYRGFPNVAFQYKSEDGAILRFKLEYKRDAYSEGDDVSLEFQKGANKMESSAHIHFSTSDDEEKECLYSLQSVLAHLGKPEMYENYRKVTDDDKEQKLKKRKAAIAKHKKELAAERKEQEAQERADREINDALDDL